MSDFERALDELFDGLADSPDFELERLIERYPQFAAELRGRVVELRALGLFDATPIPMQAAAGDVTSHLREAFGVRPVDLPLDVPTQPGRGVDADEFDELIAQRRLGERYRVIRRYARGGMGEIYVGYDARLRRLVALKVLRLEGGISVGSSEFKSLTQRLYSEGCITAQLEHPGIVPMYDVVQHDDQRLVLVMKLVRGTPLSRLIQELNRGNRTEPDLRSPRAQAELVIRICDAVAFAHQRGVLHRDLKPSNVVVGSHGEALVMDWGLAMVVGRRAGARDGRGASVRVGHDLTLTGESLGTPPYMSPEQARGEVEHFDQRTDVFGVGAVLYHLAAGAPPYDDVDREAITARARKGELNDPFGKDPACRAPHELLAVCRKAMAFDPARRYAQVGELAADLRRFLSDEPSSTWSERVDRRAVKLVRRNPTRATGVVAAAVLVSAGALGWAVLSKSEGRRQVLEQQARARALVTELDRIDEAETSRSSVITDSPQGTRWSMPGATEQQQAQAEQLFSQRAERMLDLLATWNVSLESAQDVHRSSQALARVGDDVRANLLVGLYRLCKHLAICGVAPAAWVEAHPEIETSRRAEWLALARRHARLARAASQVRPLLEALGDQRVGLAAWDELIAAQSDQVEHAAQSLAALAEGASIAEVEFVSFVLLDLGAPPEAAELLERALRRAPDSFWLHARRARMALDSSTRLDAGAARDRELERAIVHSEASLALWPESRSAHVNLGLAYNEAGRQSEAITVYRRVLGLDPDYGDAWINLGSIYLDQERWDEAIDAARRATVCSPRDPAAFKLLGLAADRCANGLDRLAPRSDECARIAVDAFTRGEELDPGDWELSFGLGGALLSQGDFERAIGAFDRGLLLKPKGRDLRNFKAEALFALGRTGDALELVLTVLADFPDDETAGEHFELGLNALEDDAVRAQYDRRRAKLGTGR